MFINFNVFVSSFSMRFLFTAIIAVWVVPNVYAQRSPMNPVDILGVESCAECHEEMADAWQSSAHARSFESLVGGEAAARMASILKISPFEIPMKDSCVRCHYTQEWMSSSVQPIEAVSCESCHGGGFDWIDEHNRKSLPRDERISRSTGLGMNHPASIYSITKTCYECHVVDDEQLVNMAGHPALSEGFEYLSWYSGEVSHNFMTEAPDKVVKVHSEKQKEIPQARRRMLYLTGKLQHVIFTLRALSRAKDPPVDRQGNFIMLPNGNYTYAVQHAMKLKSLEKDLKEVLRSVSIPQYSRALALIRGLDLKTGHSREMEAVAEQLSQLTEQFSTQFDGQRFAAIDPLLKREEPRYSEN